MYLHSLVKFLFIKYKFFYWLIYIHFIYFIHLVCHTHVPYAPFAWMDSSMERTEGLKASLLHCTYADLLYT